MCIFPGWHIERRRWRRDSTSSFGVGAETPRRLAGRAGGGFARGGFFSVWLSLLPLTVSFANRGFAAAPLPLQLDKGAAAQEY